LCGAESDEEFARFFDVVACLDDAAPLLDTVPCVGVAPRPLYLLPLLRTGSLSALLTREAPDLDWAEHFGVHMLSVEQISRVRADQRGDRDELNVLPELMHSRWAGRELRLASYTTSTRGLLTALAGVGANVLAEAGSGTSALPKDKIEMREWFRQLKVPVPVSTVVDSVGHAALRRRFGDMFVAQRPRGNGGHGTYLIRNEDDVAALPARSRWLISEYAGDTVINFHAFVPIKGTPLVLRPSVQLTDVAGIGSGFGQYSGSDFAAPAHLPATALSRCQEAMVRIARALGGLGYRGLFGVDFVLRGDDAHALELNRRMQGSTWLLGELELDGGTLPTMLRHVLERHGISTTGDADLSPADGGQLIIRHTGRPARLLRSPRSGVHRLRGARLCWRRPGRGLLECGPQDCALINVPQPGTLLYPGAILARLITRTALTNNNGGALTGYGRRILDSLRRLYVTEPHEEVSTLPGRASSLRNPL
jgi:hypothetical protein